MEYSNRKLPKKETKKEVALLGNLLFLKTRGGCRYLIQGDMIMKKFLGLILATVLLLSCMLLGACGETNNPQDSDKGINVVLLCGQSNAEGHTHNSALQLTGPTFYNKYLAGNSKTMIAYNCDFEKYISEGFRPVALGMGFNASRFGPEIGMAEVFDSLDNERPIYIIKYTAGGTNLAAQWRPESAGGGSNNLFYKMIDYAYAQLEALVALGYTPYVKAFCWMQGEADSMSDLQTEKYAEYEEFLFQDIATYFDPYTESAEEGIKMIDAGISSCITWKNYEEVNKAKKANVNSDTANRAYIDTLDLAFLNEPFNAPDHFHYDSLAMIELGKRFAQAIVNFDVLV